jgi:ferric-dicitrate binding protein FerR (iron transport regulator)
MMDAADARIIEYVASVAQQGLGQVTEAELEQGWQRLESRLARERYLEPAIPLRARFPWLRAGLAGTIALALGVTAYRMPFSLSNKPLHYMVEGATVEAAESITAASGARVLFSDESRLGLDASARIKVLGTDAHGAQVALADGSIDVMVKPREHSSWRFEAGPFSVRVKGTAFRLGFEAAKGIAASGGFRDSGPPDGRGKPAIQPERSEARRAWRPGPAGDAR